MTAPVKPLQVFHNTTNLTGDKLKQREIKNGSQNDAILKFFRRNPGLLYTPFEIWKVMNLPRTPLTSIRRAMSDLTKLGYLEKTGYKKLAQYGAESYTWKLRE
jgi:hypothetical protein